MTDSVADEKAPRLRRLACAACGADFSCTLNGPCWCSDEAFRLPVPPKPASDGGAGDCLCPDCLRKYAASLDRPAR